MSQQFEHDAWSRYWAADRLDSCIAGRGDEDEANIFGLWRDFLSSLPNPCRVIDLAAGNGAVSIRLNKAARMTQVAISLDAVDIADINPKNYLKNHGTLPSAIHFRGQTDITTLPFKDGVFDGAVSQFGFEYAPQKEAALEMLRVLKPAGYFQLLIHNQNSALVASNVAKVTEINSLLQIGGVVDSIHAYLSAPGEADKPGLFAALESAGRALQQHYEGALPKISAEIFTAISQLIERTDLSIPVRVQATTDMRLRLEAEGERMRQLEKAAMAQTDIDNLSRCLRSSGAASAGATEFRVGSDKALLGWVVKGQKS
jgi:SAM-dependent methyltransferase